MKVRSFLRRRKDQFIGGEIKYWDKDCYRRGVIYKIGQGKVEGSKLPALVFYWIITHEWEWDSLDNSPRAIKPPVLTYSGIILGDSGVVLSDSDSLEITEYGENKFIAFPRSSH